MQNNSKAIVEVKMLIRILSNYGEFLYEIQLYNKEKKSFY